jgi:NACHT conflict system protein/NACHT domain-containing protein
VADLFIGLAAAIVKAGLTIWLKDGTFAADASSSITDVVSDRLSDELDQRKARRFFEDLEVPVGKRMRSLRQVEFAAMPENEWTAAVLAVTDSFNRAQLTAKDLFSRDLDPLYLERYIRARNRQATRDLSADGTALYDRLLTDGCAYVIEISDKLPRFQVGVFTELLRRDRQILAGLDEVLDRIPDRAAGRSKEAQFVTACRRRIASRMDRLELFGLDFESRWYPLSIAYVSLRTDQRALAGSQSVEDQLAASSRTVLTGRAGSGKTTVLQWLAVNAARSSFTGSLTGFNDCFPFFIRLRDYVGEKLPVPERFLAGSAPLLVDEAPAGWVRDQLDSGRALVLVDGVDELPSHQRGAVADWLGGLVERFPDASYVVTTRPTAISDRWLDGIGFTRSLLEAMPPALVRQFIGNWHEATRSQVTDQDDRAELDRYQQSLLTEISKDRHLRDLADTPLLAGLLCALNRYLRGSLPRRRTEIYERAIAMLDQRDRVRGITSPLAGLDLAAKTHILADLALWMVRNGETEVDLGAAAGQIGRSAAGLSLTDQPAPAEILSYLLERSGLLREPAAGRLDFVHRTFQEYLAGQAAVDCDAIGELIANAGNDQWGEVVQLAAGQANQTQAAVLIRGLLRRTWRGHDRYARRALAVACLDELRSLDPALRREIMTIIPGLLPPRSFEQAEKLAVVGEPLLDLLGAGWRRTPQYAEESIRAASLIGGSAAMDAIVLIAGSLARLPELELGRAWQYFDPEEYAARVLSAVGVRRLVVYDERSLAALANVTSLTAVSVNFDLNRADLSVLSMVPDLRDLDFMYPWPHRDLEALPPIRSLQSLTFYAPTELTSLAGIGRQIGLHEIAVYNSPELTSAAELSELLFLEKIVLSDVESLDLSAFLIPDRRLQLILLDCGEVDLLPLAGFNELSIARSASTRLRHAEVLGPGSVVLTAPGRLRSMWPLT